MIRAAALASAALALAGCGTQSARGCADAPTVTAAGLTEPPPAGFEARAADAALVDPLVASAREELGEERWRGYSARLLTRPGDADAVLVIVLPAAEPNGGPDELVKTAELSTSALRGSYDVVRVLGQDGILRGSEGRGFVAQTTAGDCAALLLNSTDRDLLLEVGGSLRLPGRRAAAGSAEDGVALTLAAGV